MKQQLLSLYHRHYGDPVMRAFVKAIVFTLVLLGIPAAVHCVPAQSSLNPWAQIIVHRNEKDGTVELELTTFGKPGGDTFIKTSVDKGIDIWDKFDVWYEDLFSLTYVSPDYKRLWKQTRQRGASLGKAFISDKMLAALQGCKLLVVVDEEKPFPADTFRFADKWLFEIVPIVHSFTSGPKDVSDSHKYRKVLVLDCQGPKDREGKEAPGVSKNLESTPGATHSFAFGLNPQDAIRNLKTSDADILHLATHAHPDKFFPGRENEPIRATELQKMKLPFRTVLSTGCNTGNPVFARGMIHDNTRFFIASMYVTSGKDGIVFADDFYRAVFSGKTPFDAFYTVKSNITGNKSTYPDILRFAFFVN